MKRRVGHGSYVISTKNQGEQSVHDDQLKPHQEDEFVGQPRKLHYWRGGAYNNKVGHGELEVEEIREHR